MGLRDRCVADLVEERERAGIAFQCLAGGLAQRRLGLALDHGLESKCRQGGNIQTLICLQQLERLETEPCAVVRRSARRIESLPTTARLI